MRRDTRFTGVVKTATRGYPMKHLSEIKMTGRGDQCSMHIVCQSDFPGKKLLAVSWVDRNRRYFISTAGTTLLGVPYERLRWRMNEGKSSVDINKLL